ncbi:MAG: nicotinate phosphoribosyltransferase [Phycisphaerae bacterium]|nr:nicotinate phosphoribosyltransferase [Phycisphaerae bacterium]
MREPLSLFPGDDVLGLMTDFYELTMVAGYWSTGHMPRATFEAFVRALPPNRQYLLTAGLEQAVHYLLNLQFTGRDIDWLRSLDEFRHVKPGFWNYLRAFRFDGDVWAVPEGTVIFGGEPLVRIAASLPVAQLVETYLLTTLNVQTLIATKAARICDAAEGRPVVDFGARRAHGPQAGLLAARASFIGGCVGTSNVHAARTLGIKPVGTQAHSWIMSYDDEFQAFQAYADVFPQNTICLIDTYDTMEGARTAARLGHVLKGVRLDSGDLVQLSHKVRCVLDEAGLNHVKIVGSSDLNEFTIREMLAAGARIDLFGVGTDMVTSKDQPALSVVYKLVEIEKDGAPRPVVKLSAGKATLGGAKQLFRFHDGSGRFCRDVLAKADETLEGGEALMVPVIHSGKLVAELPDLTAIRQRAQQQIGSLPPHLREFRGLADYPVGLSDGLRRVQENPVQGVQYDI